MNYGDDEWFQYPNEFNKQADSPGAAGHFNEFAGNIDNIPLNDDVQLSPGHELDFELTANLDEFQYGIASPNNAQNGQQPGPSSVGQYQNMHLMQNSDTYDQHVQPSTSVGYNSFEMPTVVNANLEVDPFQDLRMDDPNAYYANQQPSTSMGNDMGMSDTYGDMIGQSTSGYMPQMDQMGGPSSVSNQSHQQQQQMGIDISPAAKPKSKKSRPSHKKKPPVGSGAMETVGTALTKVNKMSQQIEKSAVNDGAGGSQKIEARISAEDSILVATLMNELASLQAQMANEGDDPQLVQKKADLEAQIANLFSRNISQTGANDSAGEILTQIQNFTAQPVAPNPNPQSSQPKKSAAKRKGNNQHTKAQQQQQQNMQQQSHQPPQKELMEPPTTTLVPSSNSNYINGSNENYSMYQPMDQQSTSQQYGDYQQHDQIHSTKVVPSMNQRTHNYRQSVMFSSNQNNNAPGPSPQRNQQIEHMHHDPYDQQGSSQQMYIPQQLDDQTMYRPQSQQETEPTLGDALRQGRFHSGGQDTPTLRQQLMTNVNASSGQKMLAPTPSPGNLHGNNNTMQYGEMQHHNSYPQSQEHHHSQHGYNQEYENRSEYFGVPDHYQQYSDRTEMYQMGHEQPMMEPMYPQVPEVQVELTKEEVEARLEEARQMRSRQMKQAMLQQITQLEGRIDESPFLGKLDLFKRMLPFHHFTQGEEPVAEFDNKFRDNMRTAMNRTHAIGNRIRNIVLRDTMRSQTEWEENMLMFLETESERRQLEEDRQLMERDPNMFVNSSEIIRNVLDRSVSMERTRQKVPPMPAHLRELDLNNGQLTHLYKEYEFDSYDENRPKASPSEFVYEEELESESEPEEEVTPVKKDEEFDPEPISDLSPIAGFPQLSPIPSNSPARSRNESESSAGDWKDEEESPLLSPETGFAVAVEEFRREIYDKDLDKTEPFPFEQISKVARQQKIAGSSVDSSLEGSSADSVLSRKSVSPHPEAVVTDPLPKRKLSSSSQVSAVCKQSSTLPQASLISTMGAARIFNREDSGSPEIDETFTTPKIKTEDIKPIDLPVPLHSIKKEKEDMPKLKLRVPVAVYQKGIEIAASGDDTDVQEISNESSARKPIKLKIKLGAPNTSNIKREEPSPERDSHSISITTIPIPSIAEPPKSPIFKTPLVTPIKPNSAERKRRGSKIEDSPENKKAKEPNDLFATPKNGKIQERFLQTMTSGRKITMKIRHIPRNINHFVTPRRDGKGNMRKNLSPSRGTRLKMKLIRTNGQLSVKFTEKNPENGQEEELTAKVGPRTSNNTPVKPRPAPASRKGSVEVAAKKNKLSKGNIYSNRFNPFSTKPAASSVVTGTTRLNATAPPVASTTTSNAPKPINPLVRSNPDPLTMPIQKSLQKTPQPPQRNMMMPTTSALTTSTSGVNTSSSFAQKHPSNSFSFVNSMTSLGTPIRRPAPIAAPISTPIATQPAAAAIPTTSSPIVPKIEMANYYPSEVQPKKQKEMKLSKLLPWMSDTDDSVERKQSTSSSSLLMAPESSTSTSSSLIFPTSSTAAPSSSNYLNIKQELIDEPSTSNPQDSPRATSSMSLSFFDDSGPNAFPFLHSPKRTNEPLPIVEFSDDEENDLAHSTFSHATDHLLSTSNLSNPVNGAPPHLPWPTNP